MPSQRPRFPRGRGRCGLAGAAGAGEDAAMNTLLQDLRVVEISAFVAAPLGGMTMAQMGADVNCIDPLGGGVDFARWPVTDNGASLDWAGLNKGKRSLALALDRPEGREIARALVTAPGPGGGILPFARRKASCLQGALRFDHHAVQKATGFPALQRARANQKAIGYLGLRAGSQKIAKITLDNSDRKLGFQGASGNLPRADRSSMYA